VRRVIPLAVMLVLAGCGGSGGRSAAHTVPPSSASTTTTTTPVPSWNASRLLAADGAANDNLGGAIWYDTFHPPVRPVYYATPGEAALSSDGTVALVGAPGHGQRGKPGAGAAYVFRSAQGKWSQIAELVAPDAAAYDGFGWSVALSGDGHDAIVGAPYRDGHGTADNGTVYFFHDRGGRWTEVAEVRPTDNRAYDGFGSAVAFSRDGSLAIAGAPAHQVGANKGQGVAYLMRRAGTGWSVLRAIVAKGAPNDYFGGYVALSADGSTALVTRTSHVDGSHMLHTGATYIYQTANRWRTATLRVVFTDPNHNADKTSDQYGVHAVLSDDGRVAAVAAPDVNVGDAYGAGTTYVYATSRDWADRAQRSGTVLRPPQPVHYGYYGSCVALSSDGKTLFIGVDGGGSNDQGAGYVVRPSTSAAAAVTPVTPWAGAVEQTLLPAPESAKGRFGTAVSMSARGNALLGTAPWLPVGSKPNQGAAYVLVLAPANAAAQT
jgi:hypothetical protein